MITSTRRWLLPVLFAWPLFSWAQTPPSAPRVKFTTNQGDIVLELDAKAAPATVANFLNYVRDKHYDGTVFHRVIDGFMIQGGGFDAQLRERPTRAPVAHEGRQALERGGMRNINGTIAMARTSDPNSATAQFFINVRDNAFLDPSTQSIGYTVFGQVVSGMDVVQKIKSLPTGPGGPFRSDVPRTPVIIQTATLVTP